MQLVKGVEIIAKRDKVTYATNVTGKWKDYSIETEHGKRVKETFELAKREDVKNDQERLQKAADNLRVLLSNEFLHIPEPKQLEEALVEDVSNKVVVTAGVNNRTGRQLFICVFEDSDEYSITVVPSVMTRGRAEHLINFVTQDIQDRAKKSKVNVTPKIPEFEIVSADMLSELLKKGQS